MQARGKSNTKSGGTYNNTYCQIFRFANGKVQEVRGDGVVGEQPHLKPGQGFRYSSGAVLETPVGAMHGSYQMVADDGERFDAPIAPFTLAIPGVLH